jgi:hypothetical protein
MKPEVDQNRIIVGHGAAGVLFEMLPHAPSMRAPCPGSALLPCSLAHTSQPYPHARRHGMLWGRGPWPPPGTAIGGYGRHFRSRGRHLTNEEMAHWILRWAVCSHNKCAMRHATIGLMKWTNEGEGQLRNIPSCPKINFILHSTAWGGRGAWAHSMVGGDDVSSFVLTSALDAVRSTCVQLRSRR